MPPAKKMKQNDGKAVAPESDDVCRHCLAFYNSSLQWLPWPAFVKLMKENGSFCKEARQAICQKKLGETPAFHRCSVEQISRTGLFVQRRGFFMDRDEFMKASSGKAPEACSAPLVEGLNEHGERVKGYAVADPAHPYREFVAVGSVEEVQGSVRMKPEDHWMPSQGVRLQQALQQERQSKTIRKMLQKGGLKTMQELTSDLGEATENDDDNDDDDDEEPLVSRLSRLGSGSDLGSKSGISRKGSFGGGKANRLSDRPGDNPEGLAESAAHWKDVLDFSKVMSGKALGREKGFAWECVDRLKGKGMVTDANHLRSFLQLVELAEQLTPKRITTVEFDRFKEALEKLVVEEVDFPSPVKEAIVNRMLDELEESALHGDKAKIDEYLCLANPFCFNDEGGVSRPRFDPLLPCIAGTDGDDTSKMQWFTRRAVKGLLSGLASAGQMSTETMLYVAKSWQKMYDVGLDPEVAEHIDKFICEILQCARVLEAVCDLPSCKEDTEDITALLGPASKLQGLPRVFRDVMMSAEWYAKPISDALQHASAAGLWAVRVRNVTKQLRSLPGGIAALDKLPFMLETVLLARAAWKSHDFSGLVKGLHGALKGLQSAFLPHLVTIEQMQVYVGVLKDGKKLGSEYAKDFETIISEVESSIKSSASDSRVRSLAEAAAQLSAELAKGVKVAALTSVDPLQQALAANKGWQFAGGDSLRRVEFVNVVEAILRSLSGGMSSQDSKTLFSLVTGLLQCWPADDPEGSDYSRSVACLSTLEELDSSMQSFLSMGQDVASAIMADQGCKQIRHVKRLLASAAESLRGEQKLLALDVLALLLRLDIHEQSCEEWKKHGSTVLQTEISKAMSTLGPLLGAPGPTPWYARAQETDLQDWPHFQAFAKQSFSAWSLEDLQITISHFQTVHSHSETLDR